MHNMNTRTESGKLKHPAGTSHTA